MIPVIDIGTVPILKTFYDGKPFARVVIKEYRKTGQTDALGESLVITLEDVVASQYTLNSNAETFSLVLVYSKFTYEFKFQDKTGQLSAAQRVGYDWTSGLAF